MKVTTDHNKCSVLLLGYMYFCFKSQFQDLSCKTSYSDLANKKFENNSLIPNQTPIVSVSFVSAHDMYFAFDQKDVVITECDTIKWTWQTAFYVQDTLHGIYQTVSETNTTKVTGGIDSGAPTRAGNHCPLPVRIAQ